MTKKSVSNINDLLQVALETVDLLRNGEIEPSEAKSRSESVDTVVNVIKTQFEYAKLLKEKPMIPFLQECHVPHPNQNPKTLDVKPANRLE